VALACGAAGVHVGADDVPVSALRRIVPPGYIVGASIRADVTGADYVGVGPVFPTASKADAAEAIGIDGFEREARRSVIPAVAIGGITAGSAGALRRAGAAGVAVIAAVFGTDDPEAAARAIRTAWNS
jgi:thiamine-phosphate diphosphorylase